MLTQDAIGRLAANGTSVGLVLRVLENGRPVGPKTRAYLTHREASPVAALGLAVQRLLELSRGGGDGDVGGDAGVDACGDAGGNAGGDRGRSGGDGVRLEPARPAERLVDRMVGALLALQREDGLFGESPRAPRRSASRDAASRDLASRDAMASPRGRGRSVGWMRDRGASGDVRAGRTDGDGVVTPAWSAEVGSRSGARRHGPSLGIATDSSERQMTMCGEMDRGETSGPGARHGGEISPRRGMGSPPPAASGPLVAASAVAVRALLAYRAHQARMARCGARPQARIDDAIERGMLALARRQAPDGRLNRDIVASAIVLWQLGRESVFIDAGADVDALRTVVRREAARPSDTTRGGDVGAVTPAFARLAG